VREPASGSLADRARRLRLAALAYDLAYAEFTGQERSEVSDNLGRFAGIFMPQHGMIGDYRFSAATALPCGAGSAAVGLAALASLGERGAFRAPESRAAPVQVGEARLGDGAPSAGRSRLNEALAARWRTARERHARTEEAVHVRPALLAASRDARRCLSMVAAMAGAGRDAPDALQARDTMDGLHAFAAACETAGMPPLLQASADPWVCAFGIGREQAERIAEQPGAASCLKLAQVLIADGVACPR
jgi:hypothetical protein